MSLSLSCYRPLLKIEVFIYFSKFLESVGTISFSFVVHDCSFLFYQTLDRPTGERWAKLVHVGLGASTCINLTLAVFGNMLI